MTTTSSPKLFAVNGFIVEKPRPIDRNLPGDADPAMWLDRSDLETCWSMKPDPNQNKYGTPAGSLRNGYVALTDAMRDELLSRRRAAGLTQANLGRLVNRSTSFLCHIEQGDVQSVNASVYDAMLAACDAHISTDQRDAA
jgi:DNA-binding XRE family transcriptional regulator